MLQDLDRHLASVLQPVAELRRVEPAAFGLARDVDGDLRHLRDGVGQEEMIQGDLFHFAAARRQSEHPPDDLLIDTEFVRDVAHARWPEPVERSQQGLGAQPDPLLVRRHAHFMMRPAQPGAVQHDHARRHHALHCRGEQRRGQARMERQPQLLLPHALQVGTFGMEGVERRHGSGSKALPRRARQGDGPMAAREQNQIVALDRLPGRIRRGGPVAEEGVEIDKAARTIERCQEGCRGIRRVERQQLGAALGSPPLALRRAQVDQHAAANGAAGGGVAHDEAVARSSSDRLLEDDLHQLRLVRRDRLIAQHHQARSRVRCTVMDSYRHPLSNRPALRP
ncbi:MAG TPA: hypothetical protein VGJ75_26420 [Dongiaceae bacterium]